MRTVQFFGRYTLFQFTNSFPYDISPFDPYLDYVAVVNAAKSGFITYQSGEPSPFTTFNTNSGYIVVTRPSTPFSISIGDIPKPDFLQFNKKYNVFEYPFNVETNLNDYSDYIEAVLITNNSRTGFTTIYQPGFSGPSSILKPGSAYLLIAFGDFVIPNPEVSPTPTGTPEPTPSNTPPPTPTPTPDATTTPTPTPDSSPTPTPQPTITATPSITPSPTPTVGTTPGPTPTLTPTKTGTPVPTPTVTKTNTPSVTRTPSNTPTNAPTNTPTCTPTNTITSTNTPTQTKTPTQTRTPSLTPTNSPTPNPTPTQTSTNGQDILLLANPDDRVIQIVNPDPYPNNKVIQIGPPPTPTATPSRTPAVTPTTTTTLTQSNTPSRSAAPQAPYFINIYTGNGTVNLKSLYDAAGGDNLANNDICFIFRENRGTTDPNGYAIDTGTWSTSIAANRRICIVLPGDYNQPNMNNIGVIVSGARGAPGTGCSGAGGQGGDCLILRRNIFISGSLPGTVTYWNPGLGYSGGFRGGGGGGGSASCVILYPCYYTGNCGPFNGNEGAGWTGSAITYGFTGGGGACNSYCVPRCCPWTSCCGSGCAATAGAGGTFGAAGGAGGSGTNQCGNGGGGAGAPNGYFGINRNGFDFTYV